MNDREHLCESPIETALYRAMRSLGMDPDPQVTIGRHRVDFAIGKTVVECDGHEFHASRARRTNDASRDRALIAGGFCVVRFTGTEISRNASECALEVWRLVNPGLEPPTPTNTAADRDPPAIRTDEYELLQLLAAHPSLATSGASDCAFWLTSSPAARDAIVQLRTGMRSADVAALASADAVRRALTSTKYAKLGAPGTVLVALTERMRKAA